MSTTLKQVLKEVEEHLAKSGTSASQFGVEIMNDSSLVFRMRDGGEIRLATIDKIRQYISRSSELRSVRSKSRSKRCSDSRPRGRKASA